MQSISVVAFSSSCMPNPCLNDGFCAEDKANDKGYLCVCRQGFTGKQCESKKNIERLFIALTFNKTITTVTLKN